MDTLSEARVAQIPQELWDNWPLWWWRALGIKDRNLRPQREAVLWPDGEDGSLPGAQKGIPFRRGVGMEFLEEPNVEERLRRLEWAMERVIQGAASDQENPLRRRMWTGLFQTWTKGLGVFEDGTETTCETTGKGNGDAGD